jgi:hypothetical protein
MSYDAKAVKIPKSVKVMASSFATKEQQKAFIKRFVTIAETNFNNYQSKNKNRGKV